MTVSNKQNCSYLLEKLKKHQNLDGKKATLCFAGKVLDMDKPIGSYLKEDGVVTVFVRNAVA